MHCFKYFICFCATIFLSPAVTAQNRNIFLELGGSGGLGSVNYEWMKIPENSKNDSTDVSAWARGVRLGTGFTPVDKNNGIVIVVPVMGTLIYHKNKSPHGVEIGAGLAPSITTKGSWYVKSPLALGYRYEAADRKFFYRVTYTPIVGWLVDYNWQHWAGISIGYKLK